MDFSLCEYSPRLVFISDGAGVGVIIRSVKRYDLVNIKQRSRNQSFPIALTIPSLTIKWKPDCRGRKKNFVPGGPEDEPCDWFHSSASAYDWDNLFSLDRKPRSDKQNRKKMETFWFLRLRFRRPYDSANVSVVWFSLDVKRPEYDSDYDSDSVDNENQRLTDGLFVCLFFCFSRSLLSLLTWMFGRTSSTGQESILKGLMIRYARSLQTRGIKQPVSESICIQLQMMTINDKCVFCFLF